MAAAKTSAARGAAEAGGTSVTIKFLGLKLAGPATMPSTFALDAAALAAGDEGGLHRIITSVLAPEEYAKVREAVAAENSEDGGNELLGDLVTAISEAYGVGEGE